MTQQVDGNSVDDVTPNGPVLAADGTPLKTSLRRSLRLQKLRALALIAPLLGFILITFLLPIVDMLFRSVENQIVAETLPETVMVLADWDATTGDLPNEQVFTGLYLDLYMAQKNKVHTRLGTRLNYENTGMSSLFRKSGREVRKFDTEQYGDAFVALDPAWKEPAVWSDLMGDAANRAALPITTRSWDKWVAHHAAKNKDLAKAKIEPVLYTALYSDLMLGNGASSTSALVKTALPTVAAWPQIDIRASFINAVDDWGNHSYWETIQRYSPAYTPGYFLNAVDMQQGEDGPELRPERQRIYVMLFKRTLFMSLVITGSCILLGYPVAWLLANVPVRQANLLMILVLLPFWTSLLVRTSAWKVMLQQQGVVNDLLVWLNIVPDSARLIMINNQFGTIVAMTHILLPFMILPLYSVMQTIPETYLRAAKSMGATNWTAFWRVYFPQSVPGIGAGSILVFILSIGYYITPEIVGGTTGSFISNRIAFHISSSLNWGLGAALGTILLSAVMILYWVYDRVVGIDNVKLGG